jgi:U-box domain
MTCTAPQLEGAAPVASSKAQVAVVNSRTGHEVEIPHEFVCPITQCIMEHPLLSKRGFHNFERAAILQWLGQSDLCPVTRQSLKPSDLFPNRNLEARIKAWRIANDIDKPADEESQASKHGVVTFLDVKSDRHKATMSTSLHPGQQPASLTSAIMASAGASPTTDATTTTTTTTVRFPESGSVPSRQTGERRRKFLSRILTVVSRDIEEL